MSTAVAATAPAPAARLVDKHVVAQTAAMAKRSIRAIIRQPAMVLPTLIFPLFFAALGSSSFSRATGLPGFPRVDSFLSLSLAASVIQGVLFGTTNGGAALATDIENGFFDRLLASPTSRVSILIGSLAGSALFGSFQALFFTVVMVIFGVHIYAGIAGLLVIVLAGALIGLAVGGFLAAMALRTGSAEAVQGIFPLLFITLFFSSAFFPRETMRGVYRRIADVNPVSHLYEGMRDLVIKEFALWSVARALLIPFLLCFVSIPLALSQLRWRVNSR